MLFMMVYPVNIQMVSHANYIPIKKEYFNRTASIEFVKKFEHETSANFYIFIFIEKRSGINVSALLLIDQIINKI